MKAMEEARRTDLRRLLSDYAEVCNRAMDRNVDRFWYRQILRLARATLDETTFQALVYLDDPDEVLAAFTLHFDPRTNRLIVLPPGAFEVSHVWKVPLDYLEDVVYERPDWYIEHPTRLDGVWAARRTRDALRGHGSTIGVALAGLAIGIAVGILAVRAAGSGGRRPLFRRRRGWKRWRR